MRLRARLTRQIACTQSSRAAASSTRSRRASSSRSSCSASDDDEKVELTPVLLVDGDTVLAGPKALNKAKVTAKVVGEAKGPKITGFTYKNKSNQRKRWGHRQRYSTIEITGISKG